MVAHRSIARKFRTKRGMALLLVMIGMVICTILTAGFLASQGTSIGIARNERDSAKCRGIAQTGIDMCYWLIRNKSDWRETMSQGSWLSNAAVGDGVVNVSAVNGANATSFSTDPTQAVVLTSTGTYDSRTFTLVATIRPTGGGTVFANGNFINGTIAVGNGDLLTAATVDSYNSGVGDYNSLLPGSNAAFGSADAAASSLMVYFPSVFRGSYSAAPNTLLSNIIDLVGLVSGPSSTSVSTEKRTPGTVILPNTTGLASRGSFSYSNSLSPVKSLSPGVYSAVTITSAAASLPTSGIYYVTGNVSFSGNTSTILTVNDGVSAVLIVGGNFSMSAGNIKLATANSQLAVYCINSFTLSGGKINYTQATNHMTVFGSSTASAVTISGSGTQYSGSIYAPQAAVTMQTSNPQFFGAIIAQSLSLKDSSQMHFDEALKSLRISNVTGGSASPGTADYQMAITGGPGIGRYGTGQ